MDKNSIINLSPSVIFKIGGEGIGVEKGSFSTLFFGTPISIFKDHSPKSPLTKTPEMYLCFHTSQGGAYIYTFAYSLFSLCAVLVAL